MNSNEMKNEVEQGFRLMYDDRGNSQTTGLSVRSYYDVYVKVDEIGDQFDNLVHLLNVQDIKRHSKQ